MMSACTKSAMSETPKSAKSPARKTGYPGERKLSGAYDGSESEKTWCSSRFCARRMYPLLSPVSEIGSRLFAYAIPTTIANPASVVQSEISAMRRRRCSVRSDVSMLSFAHDCDQRDAEWQRGKT